MKNKKTKIAIIAVIALVLVTIGITYAYWLITRTQEGTNVITTGCLDIALTDGNDDITLSDQFPISDEEGMKLTPYTFTVTNNCNTSVDYQVALEAIDVADEEEIASNALKVSLNDTTKLYSAYSEVATTVSGAYESRAIGYSRLSAKDTEGSTDSYKLRIWIDADADISEMNKIFQSKITVTIGQGFETSFAEGTLAYSILSNYGGANAASEIDATEYDHRVTASGNQYASTSSNYYYGTSYAYDAETGKYTLDGTIVQATTSECRAGTKTCGKYTLKNTSSTYSSATLYEVTDFQSSGNYVTANTIKYVNAFGIAETTESSLHKAQDDLGDSYYFRGAPTDNYVQFGTYAADTTLTVYDYNSYSTKTVSIAAGTPMYWRIVRINGDGTIRLIYDGVEKVANGVAHTATIANTAYNTNYDDAKYVGYTYDNNGTETDSTIKDVVDAWYDANLKTSYSGYIADGIFCNDREVASYTYYDANYNVITDSTAAVYTDTNYAPYARLGENKAPVLTCTNKEDRYTTSTDLGNGKLTDAEGNARPIGLLTADEAFFAGGTTATNNGYYLYSNEAFWTSAPFNFYGIGYAYAWNVYDDGFVNSIGVGNGNPGARPVINLKADVLFEGNGSFETPFIIGE